MLDLDISSCITELRFYADNTGKITVPKEYRNDVIYGPHIKALAVDLYSEGVMANDRIADFLNAASNNQLELSNGSVYHFCKDFANKAENIIEQLETELLNQPVVATDATVITVNGKMNFIRNFKYRRYRYLPCHEKQNNYSVGKAHISRKVYWDTCA